VLDLRTTRLKVLSLLLKVGEGERLLITLIIKTPSKYLGQGPDYPWEE